MRSHLFKRPRVSMPLVMAFVLVVASACGGAATATLPAPTATSPAPDVPTATSSPTTSAAPGAAPTATPLPVATDPIPGFGEDPVRGGIVDMQAFEPPGSDTYYGGSNADNTMTHVGPIFNQIVEFDPDTREGLDLRGGVAESWEVVDGGLTTTSSSGII